MMIDDVNVGGRGESEERSSWNHGVSSLAHALQFVLNSSALRPSLPAALDGAKLLIVRSTSSMVSCSSRVCLAVCFS